VAGGRVRGEKEKKKKGKHKQDRDQIMAEINIRFLGENKE